MQKLTREEFLDLLQLTSGAFDQLQHAGHVALAFGVPFPAAPGRYLDLDLVAMAINLGLSQPFGREISTAIVVGFFDQWARAVGYAEANPGQEFFLAIGGIGWDVAKKGAKLLTVTHGTIDEISNDFRGTRDLVGYFTVNVSDIIRRLRDRGEKLRIDLSSPFFFPPDDARFEQMLTQAKRELDARIVRLRRDKRKLAAIKARRQRRDIMAVPRVARSHYPLAILESG